MIFGKKKKKNRMYYSQIILMYFFNKKETGKKREVDSGVAFPANYTAKLLFTFLISITLSPWN